MKKSKTLTSMILVLFLIACSTSPKNIYPKGEFKSVNYISDEIREIKPLANYLTVHSSDVTIKNLLIRLAKETNRKLIYTTNKDYTLSKKTLKISGDLDSVLKKLNILYKNKLTITNNKREIYAR